MNKNIQDWFIIVLLAKYVEDEYVKRYNQWKNSNSGRWLALVVRSKVRNFRLHRYPFIGNMKNGGDWHDYIWNSYGDADLFSICYDSCRNNCQIASYYYKKRIWSKKITTSSVLDNAEVVILH